MCSFKSRLLENSDPHTSHEMVSLQCGFACGFFNKELVENADLQISQENGFFPVEFPCVFFQTIAQLKC